MLRDHLFDFSGKLGDIEGGHSINVTSLTSVTFPRGLTTLGVNAFEDCDTISVTFQSKFPTYTERLRMIGEFAFHCCVDLTEVTFLKGCVPSVRMHSIAAPTSPLTFPEGLTTIEKRILKVHRPQLSNFSKSLKTIKFCAFYNCTGLTSVTFPHGLKTIEESVFEDFTSLSEVRISKTLMLILLHLTNT